MQGVKRGGTAIPAGLECPVVDPGDWDSRGGGVDARVDKSAPISVAAGVFRDVAAVHVTSAAVSVDADEPSVTARGCKTVACSDDVALADQSACAPVWW